MKDLLALIARYGGTIEMRSDTDRYGLCTEHPEYPVPEAVAEITATDVPDSVFPCADCLAGAIRTAQQLAEDAGDRNPQVTVTVSQPAAEAATRPVELAAAA